MLQYTVGLDRKGGDSTPKRPFKHLLIITILILLIVGWIWSIITFKDKWLDEESSPFCNDRVQFPIYVSLIFAYLGFILWFVQFPTRGSETIQNIFN